MENNRFTQDEQVSKKIILSIVGTGMMSFCGILLDLNECHLPHSNETIRGISLQHSVDYFWISPNCCPCHGPGFLYSQTIQTEKHLYRFRNFIYIRSAPLCVCHQFPSPFSWTINWRRRNGTYNASHV